MTPINHPPMGSFEGIPCRFMPNTLGRSLLSTSKRCCGMVCRKLTWKTLQENGCSGTLQTRQNSAAAPFCRGRPCTLCLEGAKGVPLNQPQKGTGRISLSGHQRLLNASRSRSPLPAPPRRCERWGGWQGGNKPFESQGSLHYTPEHCLLNGGFLYFGGKSHVSNGQNVSFKKP